MRREIIPQLRRIRFGSVLFVSILAGIYSGLYIWKPYFDEQLQLRKEKLQGTKK